MRKAEITRQTKETNISIVLNLDGSGVSKIDTGVGFLDHMLSQIATHGNMDLLIKCDGDTHIDDHHSTEDIAISLGKAFLQAIGDKKGIVRFAHAYTPLDEALSRCVIDISGRSYLVYNVAFSKDKIGNFDTELIEEFFVAFAHNAKITLHLESLYGKNQHHIAESCFKAFARALRTAVAIDENSDGKIPSTKGVLEC